MTDSEFENFQQALHRIKLVPREIEALAKSNELEKIIYGIEIIKADKIAEINSLLAISNKEIEDDLQKIFYPIFSKPVIEIVPFIKESSADYFFIKKSYQLSHAHGIHAIRLGDQEEISDYFYIQLFSDYFESLTQRLWELCKMLFPPKETWKLGDSHSFYTKFLNQFSKSILKRMEINKTLREFRNSINHGQVICVEGSCLILKDPNDVPEESKKEDYLPLVKGLMAYLVLFSTEMDLRTFKLLRGTSPPNLSDWLEYFDLYWAGWQTHQKFTKS